MSESLKLPRIETELEIITDRYHPDFGTPQLKKKKKSLVLHNPELYLDPDQLDTEKYDWEVFDDFYPQQSRPQTVADNIRFGKEISFDDDRPHSAPLAPVFSTEIMPKFETRRVEMLRAGRTLKKANEKLGPIRLQSLLPSSQQQKEEAEQKCKYTLPDKFHDDTLKMDKELIKRYEHAGPLKDQLRLGVDNIPILKKPFIYQPEAIMKATALRLHPPESVLNIWQDSEFPLGKISGGKQSGTEQGNETAISIHHMETCVYRMTRRYGYVFEDKEKRRKLKYAHLMKLRRVPKRNSVLRKSTMTNEVKETTANAGTDLLISAGLKTGKKITDDRGAYNSFSPMQSPHKQQNQQPEFQFPGLEEAKKQENSNESENNNRSVSPLTVQIPTMAIVSSPSTAAPKSALKDPSRTLSRIASTRRVSIKIKTEEEENDEKEPTTPTVPVTAADTNNEDTNNNQDKELLDDQFIHSVATNLSLQLGFNENAVVDGDRNSEKKNNESNECLSITTAIPESTTPVFKSPTKNKTFASSPGLLKLSFSQPSFINTNNLLPSGQQPLSARSPEKDNPLLLPAKPETIESLRQSMDSLDRPVTNLIAKSSEASFSNIPFKSLSINKNQSKSFDFGENNKFATEDEEDYLSSKLSITGLSTDSNDTSSKPTTPSSRNRQRTEEEQQQLLQQQRQRKLTPVAFSFNTEGKITDIHYESQLPKKRPSSADRSTATMKERGNRKGSALLSSPSKLLQYEEFLKQQKQEREEEREKQQILAVAATLTPSIVPISKTFGKSNDSQPFFPHYLRLEKPRRANSHRKDLTKIVFISDEDRRRERSALMSIYDMCFGDQWTRSDNWGSTLEVRFWYGIGVNVEGYVFEINLPKNNLTGRFPDMLIEFPYLEVINVDHNQLYGTLPDYALQSCEHLKILSACNNELDGGIPFNLLTNCEKVKEIWLNNNQFDGSIEDGLYEMTTLTHLCLDNNRLSGVLSTKISKLQNLIYLSLGRNQLTGVIPQTIVALQDLELLSLHSNQFEGKVPMWLDILPKLDELRLYNNPKLENHLKDMESVKSGVKKKTVK
jgi:hypothetical protein